MKNQDAKLVAFKQAHQREVKYIHNTYYIPMEVVRAAMMAVGKNGKPSRSRKLIYRQLRLMGFVIKTKRYQ